MNTSRVPCFIIGILFSVSPFAIGQSFLSGGHTSRATVPSQQAPAVSDVLIAPSKMDEGTTTTESGGDRWSACGYNLKDLIAQIFDLDPRRIELPDSDVTRKTYDVTLMLRGDESTQTIQRTLQLALEKRFGLTITVESRAMDVYVLTAPKGAGQALHEHVSASRARGAANSLMHRVSLEDSAPVMEEMQRITYEEKVCSGVASGGISAVAATIPEFGKTLEQDLDRILVNETNLAGSYDFRIGHYRNEAELFELLRVQLGVEVVPAVRNVTVLAVRPA